MRFLSTGHITNIPGTTPKKNSVSEQWVIFWGSPLFSSVSGHSSITSISTLNFGPFSTKLGWDRLGHKKMAHIDNGPGPDRNYIRENGRLKFWRKADNGPKIRFCYRTRISSMACLSPSARWLFWRLRIDLSTFLFWVTPVCVKKKTTRQKVQKAKTALALSACRDNEQKYARIESGTIITDMRNTLFTKDIAQMLSSQICTF